MAHSWCFYFLLFVCPLLLLFLLCFYLVSWFLWCLILERKLSGKTNPGADIDKESLEENMEIDEEHSEEMKVKVEQNKFLEEKENIFKGKIF